MDSPQTLSLGDRGVTVDNPCVTIPSVKYWGTKKELALKIQIDLVGNTQQVLRMLLGFLVWDSCFHPLPKGMSVKVNY